MCSVGSGPDKSRGVSKMLIPVFVMILALLGLVDSVYYTLIHYGVMGFGSPYMPMICDHKEGVCQMLANTDWASLLGLPNSIYGAGYYLMIIIFTGIRLASGAWPYPKLILAITLLAAGFSVYLAWIMVYQVHALCPLCVTAQAINIALATMFVWMLHSSLWDYLHLPHGPRSHSAA